ncbi:hypothetical protein TTRE_0000532201 [Trichuris trichiura]|uniref:Uncharacterized protein n=1 Tax=Trichuris trichiura TaxID=36087 RepID=A0A077ZB18_TRITR|nr:hypothetical protein TTRE_0000532201 [Trichuris trichiura]
MVVRLTQAVWSHLREHKKKAAFFAAVSIASVNFARNQLEERRIFNDYCLKARDYGREPIGPLENPRKVTVLVGDQFQNQKTWRKFEKYALPLLHFAGLKVDIAELASAYNDEEVEKEWKTSDTLYLVGNDSEISKRVAKQIPKLAFFPGGYDGHVAEHLLPKSYPLVRWYCQSAMAVIAGVCRNGSAVKCKVDGKPAYLAISCLHVGDIGETGDLKNSVLRKVKERWFYLRKAITHRSSENFHLSVAYAEPCSGCKRCSYIDPNALTKPWWSWLFLWRNPPSASDRQASTNKDVVNERCGEKLELVLSTSEISAFNNLNSDEPKLNIAFGPEFMSKWDYLVEAWRRVSSGNPYLTAESTSAQKTIDASECLIELQPKNLPVRRSLFSDSIVGRCALIFASFREKRKRSVLSSMASKLRPQTKEKTEKSDGQTSESLKTSAVDAAEVDSEPPMTAFESISYERDRSKVREKISTPKKARVKMVPVVSGALPVRPDPPYLISGPEDRMACCSVAECYRFTRSSHALLFIAVACLLIVIFVTALTTFNLK